MFLRASKCKALETVVGKRKTPPEALSGGVQNFGSGRFAEKTITSL
jgi:hypothetical protein